MGDGEGGKEEEEERSATGWINEKNRNVWEQWMKAKRCCFESAQEIVSLILTSSKRGEDGRGRKEKFLTTLKLKRESFRPLDGWQEALQINVLQQLARCRVGGTRNNAYWWNINFFWPWPWLRPTTQVSIYFIFRRGRNQRRKLVTTNGWEHHWQRHIAEHDIVWREHIAPAFSRHHSQANQ